MQNTSGAKQKLLLEKRKFIEDLQLLMPSWQEAQNKSKLIKAKELSLKKIETAKRRQQMLQAFKQEDNVHKILENERRGYLVEKAAEQEDLLRVQLQIEQQREENRSVDSILFATLDQRSVNMQRNMIEKSSIMIEKTKESIKDMLETSHVAENKSSSLSTSEMKSLSSPLLETSNPNIHRQVPESAIDHTSKTSTMSIIHHNVNADDIFTPCDVNAQGNQQTLSQDSKVINASISEAPIFDLMISPTSSSPSKSRPLSKSPTRTNQITEVSANSFQTSHVDNLSEGEQSFFQDKSKLTENMSIFDCVSVLKLLFLHVEKVENVKRLYDKAVLCLPQRSAVLSVVNAAIEQAKGGGDEELEANTEIVTYTILEVIREIGEDLLPRYFRIFHFLFVSSIHISSHLSMLHSEVLNGIITVDKLQNYHKKRGGGLSALWNSLLSHIQKLCSSKRFSLDDLCTTFTQALLGYVVVTDRERY